jgi:hypothetical protein
MRVYFAVYYDTQTKQLAFDMDTDVGGCHGDAQRAYNEDEDSGEWETPTPEDLEGALDALHAALSVA